MDHLLRSKHSHAGNACRSDPQVEAYVAANVQYQASTDPEYQALVSQRQQLQDPDAEAAMVCAANQRHMAALHKLPSMCCNRSPGSVKLSLVSVSG